jgi:argininosuccinate synthase
MLKDAMTSWIAPSVTGKVVLELRRGEDYTIVSTAAEFMMYGPEKLSMEKVADVMFTPEDRIGALEMLTLNVTDNREMLVHHLDQVARLGSGAHTGALPELLGGKK